METLQIRMCFEIKMNIDTYMYKHKKKEDLSNKRSNNNTNDKMGGISFCSFFDVQKHMILLLPAE